MAVLSTFREPSLGRHVHRELLRSALLDLTPIIPATACHQRNDVERYSRYKSVGGSRPWKHRAVRSSCPAPRTLVAAILLGGYVVYWLRDVLTPILLAFSIAYILDPVVDWLEAWHVPRPAGIALVLGGTLGAVGLFLVLVVPGIAADVAGVIQELPTQLARALDHDRALARTARDCRPALHDGVGRAPECPGQ